MFLIFNTFFFTALLFCSFVAVLQWRQTHDRAIVPYVGYLLGTFAHYGRQFWITYAVEFGVEAPPDPPLQWNTPLSYAALGCYFLFLKYLMNTRRDAPGLSFLLIRISRSFFLLIGANILVQALLGSAKADQIHQMVQILLFPLMIWILIQIWKNTYFFYQKLVMIGSTALIIGFVCVLMTRLVEGRHDWIRDAICCFPTPWGDVCVYHLKVGILLDVICFSWALTLRQKILLQNAVPRYIQFHKISDVKDSFLEEVQAFLEKRIGEESFRIPELAAGMHLSVAQTNRKIKEKTGLTTEQYVLKYRLEKAFDMLQDTDKSIREIGFAVGFREAAHFSNAFKRYFGKSPREMRKNNASNASNTQENAE
ncbi:MAG: helix-turn-helix domain-containing protein [Saprospiraceae bacterium]|nr:helix-turn-helix domain-containing protein [Saprospiraceae bacterium]